MNELEFDAKINKYIDNGHTIASIAKKLHCSVKRIKKHMNKHNIPGIHDDSLTVYTVARVARILHRRQETVTRWGKRGYIRIHARPGSKTQYFIKYDDLVTFLRNPDYWCLWTIDEITDDDIREFVREFRVNEPRWVTQKSIRERFNVSQQAVSNWCARGLLRAHMGFVLADDVEHFTPPCYRPLARSTEYKKTTKGSHQKAKKPKIQQ